MATAESLSMIPAKCKMAWWYFFNACLYYFSTQNTFASSFSFSAWAKFVSSFQSSPNCFSVFCILINCQNQSTKSKNTLQSKYKQFHLIINSNHKTCYQNSNQNKTHNESMNSRKQRKPLPYSPKAFISNRQNQNSPTKATVLLQEQNIEYIDALINQKQNLCTCLDLYTVSYQNQLPQKCLLHSNFVTLYCENQQKLLCVNCIYNSAAHKEHRVVPSKNSINNISRDNDENMKVLDQEIQRIKYAEQQLKSNRKKLQQEYKAILTQLDQEFIAMRKLLDQKYESTKKRIMQNFERASINNDTSSKQVTWWRETLINTRGTLPKASKNEEAEIFKHLVLGLFMEDKIDLEKLTYIASSEEMRNEFLAEIVELRELIETQIGQIAELVHNRSAQKTASRRLGVF